MTAMTEADAATPDERLLESAARSPEDREFDVALRPRTLADFVGQDRVKEQLPPGIGYKEVSAAFERTGVLA